MEVLNKLKKKLFFFADRFTESKSALSVLLVNFKALKLKLSSSRS